ncbi:MAG: T9SS type A sorting domain-containing protein [Phaeodactylibacter sp.]|nr:T9SS type A sorting domain-containing protein [Phaeodactylibacter sp.]MCB9264647.1 T9SS type A sorting domain-containing protein [Lewinellaceae bacterium]MCB9287143.1 T9SS type A sorting domain-containing protein [Lewinellaceae bacterium]
MNVSLRKQILFTLLLALAVPLALRGQVETPTIYEGQAYQYAFRSEPSSPSLSIPPAHGDAYWESAGQPYEYIFHYTPDDGFIGIDTMRLNYFKKFGNSIFVPRTVTFFITVDTARVYARPDYTTTPVGQSVTLNVTENDSTTNGGLLLKYIPLVNNGTAAITGDSSITFTPASGFEGVAYLNYVVCDDAGTCDNGTASFFVIGPSAGQPDTVTIFTRKNRPQTIYVPYDYILVGSPANGSYDESGDYPVYTPNNNYTGLDYINFDYNGVSKVVEIRVLDLRDNQLAFDDRAYMTPNDGTQEINVLSNDFYGVNSSCFQLVGSAQYGTAEWVSGQDAKGVVRYTPPYGFTGVDWFTYSICEPGNPGNTETATAYVFVSNFEPSSSLFRMSTPKVTPLVVGYSVPIQQFSFSIEALPNLGTVSFLPGQVDTTIYGRQVTGYNLILYIPGANVNSGLDEFELRYCVVDNGSCSYEKTVKVEIDILDIGAGTDPMCFDDCVWSGDTNFDGVVNMKDLLPIGLCMGEVGVPRSEVNLSQWYGQYGDDWQAPFQPAPIDLKHLDTDGDSIITALDTFAISNFYGRTHSLTSVDVPFFEQEIVLSGSIFAQPGDYVELPMLMGNASDPAKNVYGFTFPFQYNPAIIVPGSVTIDFETGSWLAYNSPILYMSKNDTSGVMEAGFTRTNGIAADGYGRIGKLGFVITDDVDGFRPGGETLSFEVGGDGATVMNSAGMTYGINVKGTTIHIVPPQEQETGLDPNQLKLYPNPTDLGFINVHMNGGLEFERVLMHDLTGRQVFDTGKVLARRMQLPVSGLNSGMYILNVYTREGVINKKFEVIR